MNEDQKATADQLAAALIPADGVTLDELSGILLSFAAMAVEYVRLPGIYEPFTARLATQEGDPVIPTPEQLKQSEMYLLLTSGAKMGILHEAIGEFLDRRADGMT